jgi:glycosyltransferase involved in cell wall biosynthesis
MNDNIDIKVSVCLCTYKRPDKLFQCLKSLLQQEFDQTFEVIVTDNDSKRSGYHVIERLKESFQCAGIPLLYLVEPVQNIALARNRSLQPARGELVAFIDDDECASSCWLEELCRVLVKTGADGVWGPVIPIVPESFPDWMRRSKLFHRENPKNYSILGEVGLRSGNALIKRKLLTLRSGPFDSALGRTGGSDPDLFLWIKRNELNVKYIWAAGAEVFEEVEGKRRYIRWHFRRAYRGGWGYSRGLAKRYGAGKALLLSTLRIIPSVLKALISAIKNCNNLQYSCMIILRNIATNLGKCGYFLGIKIEEYKG